MLNIIEIFSYGGGVRFGRESLWKRLSNGTEKLVYTIFLLHNKKKKIIMKRKVKTKVKGFRTTDGAGVKLVRVLGNLTTKEFDPILMLDSFDSIAMFFLRPFSVELLR